MHRPILRSLPVLPALLLCACQAKPDASRDADAASPAPHAERLAVVLSTPRGPVTIQAEVAATPEQQQRGLMYRKSLPPGEGMIFPFMPPRPASFWMKDTLIPLDLVFIAPDGKVSAVFANRQPYSLDPVATGQPVVAVLEIAGGEAARLGIGTGDTARWGRCPYPAGQGPTPRRFCPR